jgi:hypothetical protein
MERTASHQGWKMMGKRTKKMANTTHCHVRSSVIYAGPLRTTLVCHPRALPQNSKYPTLPSKIQSDTRAWLGAAYEHVPRSGPLQRLRVISNRSANQTGSSIWLSSFYFGAAGALKVLVMTIKLLSGNQLSLSISSVTCRQGSNRR